MISLLQNLVQWIHFLETGSMKFQKKLTQLKAKVHYVIFKEKENLLFLVLFR